jgi:hypothetical protein
MALLMESVPSIEETWIGCLGDLTRYRTTIEGVDLRDCKVSPGLGRMWYNKAADGFPDVGRIQHHLSVLARPNVVQQLFYHSKTLIRVILFQNAPEFVMFHFDPGLKGPQTTGQLSSLVESAFISEGLCVRNITFLHSSLVANLSTKTRGIWTA